jgi:hypothetical protein
MAMKARRTLSVCEVTDRSKSEDGSISERELATFAKWYRQAKKKLFMFGAFQDIQAARHMDDWAKHRRVDWHPSVIDG